VTSVLSTDLRLKSCCFGVRKFYLIGALAYDSRRAGGDFAQTGKSTFNQRSPPRFPIIPVSLPPARLLPELPTLGTKQENDP
jgi:hypothetical protein